MKVTGETIERKQIEELLAGLLGDASAHGSQDLVACRIACRIALRLRAPGRYWTIEDALARCADAWNARHGGA